MARDERVAARDADAPRDGRRDRPSGAGAAASGRASGASAAPRVLCCFDDLLVGSNVVGTLRAGGLDAALCQREADVRRRLAQQPCDVLVVGLAAAALDGVALVAALRADGSLGAIRTLGVYAHVDAETRQRAERGGFDLVVPRSRLMRDGPALVARLMGKGES